MQLDLFSPASTDADKPIACAVEIPGVRNLAPLLLLADGTWRVTDGLSPADRALIAQWTSNNPP